MITPNRMKDDVSEASYVQILINIIIILYIVKQYSATEETTGVAEMT